MRAEKPPAFFISGALGLDFLNTLATPVDEPLDWIEDGDGLLAWLAQAGLVPPAVLTTLENQAMPGELDGVAGRARTLREWFRAFLRARTGRTLVAADLADLEPINRLLDRDERYQQIEAAALNDGSALELRPVRRWRSPESLLLPIGEQLARFVCSEDFPYVKACDGLNCTLLFLDRTRGHARRWCSMAICGNRAKQSALRHRRKSHQ